MFSLTKQERLVLLFLFLIILTGSLLHWAFQKSAALHHFFSPAERTK